MQHTPLPAMVHSQRRFARPRSQRSRSRRGKTPRTPCKLAICENDARKSQLSQLVLSNPASSPKCSLNVCVVMKESRECVPPPGYLYTLSFSYPLPPIIHMCEYVLAVVTCSSKEGSLFVQEHPGLLRSLDVLLHAQSPFQLP